MTDQTKHTPGPWVTRESATHITVVGANNEVLFHDDKRVPRVAEDAHAISATPELIEACMAMIEWDNREKDHAVDFNARMELCRVAFEKARAAIAKATGSAT